MSSGDYKLSLGYDINYFTELPNKIFTNNKFIDNMSFYDSSQNNTFESLKEEIQEIEGQKNNNYKLPMSKLFIQFPDALQAIVLASCYGHNKYPQDIDWLNFKRVEGGSQNYKDAEIRHYLGGENDEESGLPEIYHQLWNKIAECQLWIEENNIDIKKESKKYLKNLAENKIKS